MSTTKHTPGEIVFDEGDGWLITGPNGEPLASVMCSDDFPCTDEESDMEAINAQSEADGKRMVACWNACKDMEDPEQAISDTLQLLKAWRRDTECPEDREEISKCITALGGSR